MKKKKEILEPPVKEPKVDLGDILLRTLIEYEKSNIEEKIFIHLHPLLDQHVERP